MKELSKEELQEAVKGALEILNDPERREAFRASTNEYLADFNKMMEESDKRRIEANKKWAEENPVQAACDHGVSFDLEAARKLLEEAPVDTSLDPEVAFIMGSSASSEIKTRWPRLCGQCPKGCGYYGIYYASCEHYTYGDW